MQAESIASSMGGKELDRTQRLLKPDWNQGGILIAEPQGFGTPILECTLATILDCRLEFDMNHQDSWIKHSLTHFKSIHGDKVPPPITNKCCFCDKIVRGNTGEESWEIKLKHIRDAHHVNGHRMAAARPDFELVRYLWGAEVIDNVKFRDWTAKHSAISPPSSPDSEFLPPVSEVCGHRRRDRRRK